MVNTRLGNWFSFGINHYADDVAGLGTQKILKCLGLYASQGQNDPCNDFPHKAIVTP